MDLPGRDRLDIADRPDDLEVHLVHHFIGVGERRCSAAVRARSARTVGWNTLLDALKQKLATASTQPLSGLYLSHVLIGKSAARALGQAR